MAGKDKKVLGAWGEDMAANFLTRAGYEVRERNVNCRRGEIDIVAVKDGDYYFVEVKTRRDPALASDLTIQCFKRRHLEAAAAEYCYRRDIGEVGMSFAAILVTPCPNAAPQVELIIYD